MRTVDGATQHEPLEAERTVVLGTERGGRVERRRARPTTVGCHQPDGCWTLADTCQRGSQATLRGGLEDGER
jgi:hypothetical protein